MATRIANRDLPVVAIGLIFLAVMVRLAPHPANVAPITAIALFGGAVLPRKVAIVLPFLAMFISDLFLGLHDLIFVTWGSFMLISLGSIEWLRNRLSSGTVIAASFVSSLGFYIITNFGVWADGELYQRSLQGLINCYVMALPFFRNTLIGDLLYTSVIFGLYWLAKTLVIRKSLTTT